MWKALLKLVPEPLQASLSGELAHRVVKGMFWSLVGAVATKGLSIAAYMLLARILGQASFGQFGMVLSTTVLFQTFANFGTSLTTTKYVAQYRSTDPGRVGRIIGLSNLIALSLGVMIAALLFAMGPWIARRFLDAPDMGPLLQIGAVAVFFQATTGAQMGILSGLEAFRSLAIGNTVVGILIPLLLLLGTWLDGLYGCVLASTLGFGLMCLVFHWFAQRELRRHHLCVSYSGLKQELPLLWNFSLPSFFMGLMVDPIGWICNAMLVNQHNGYREMALIGATASWKNMVCFVPNSVGSVLLPLLSNMHGQGEQRRARKLFYLNLVMSLVLSIGVAIPIMVFSPWIMAGYGTEFRAGVPVLIAGVLASVFICIANVSGVVLLGAGRVWLSFVFNLLWALILLGAAWLWIPAHGALGTAIAFMVAYASLALVALLWAIPLIRKTTA